MSYRLLTILLWPLLALYTIRLALRYKNRRYLRQRLGLAYPTFKSPPIWLHCASVGEVNTALPLLRLMLERYPQHDFLVTTNTVTGAYVLEKNALNNVVHSFLPIDTCSAVRRFFKYTQARLGLIMETEIWPHLFHIAQQQNIPLSIINGRLSHKTTRVNDWIKAQYQQALEKLDHLLVRSEADKNLYLQLGASERQTRVLGNLKFATDKQVEIKPLDNFNQRPFVLAASTHHDEELQLAKLWSQLDTGTLLVIAPRHPERGPAIEQQLQSLQLNTALRSQHDPIVDQTDIYIADTLGELKAFMQSADLVFMGGSLIAHGGQNLLEPASLKKPIIVGPYMHNFQAEVNLFLENEACLQVADIDQLAQAIRQLLDDPQQRKTLAQNAKQLMQHEQDVAERYLTALEKIYPEFFSA